MAHMVSFIKKLYLIV